MQKITLKFNRPQININGELYSVLKSDKAIIEDMLAIDEKYKDSDLDNTNIVLKKNDEMLNYLDELFGAGSKDAIIKSIKGIDEYGLGLCGVDGLLGEIVKAAGKSYADAIKIKYE